MDIEQSISKFFDEIILLLAPPNMDFTNYVLSFSGFISLTNVLDENELVRNNTIFNLGNNLPALSASYTPKGDLITSYSIFLDYLVPNTFNENQKNIHTNYIKQKHFFESQIVNSTKPSFTKNFQSPNLAVNANVQFTTIDNLLQELGNIESKIQELHNNGSNFKSSRMESNQDIGYFRAAVSFITGARNLTDPNIYNMAVLPIDNYKPKYIVPYNAQLLTNWKNDAVKYNFPYIINTQLSYDSLDNNLKKILPNESQNIGSKIFSNFSGLKMISISPGEWFEPAFFKSQGYSLQNGAPDFFGNEEIIGAIPQFIIIGYNMVLKIFFTAEDASAVKNALDDGHQNNRIGDIVKKSTINLNEALIPNIISYYHETNSIEISLTGPILVGVISKKTKSFITSSDSKW